MCLCVVDMLVAETWFMTILHFLHRGINKIKCFIHDYVHYVFSMIYHYSLRPIVCAGWITSIVTDCFCTKLISYKPFYTTCKLFRNACTPTFPLFFFFFLLLLFYLIDPVSGFA